MNFNRFVLWGLVGLVVVLITSSLSYFAGRKSASNEEDLEDDLRRELEIALFAYSLGVKSNWVRVHSVNSGQVYSMVREYEKKYGQPATTNGFYRDFVKADAVANDFEKNLVPVGVGTRR